MKKMNINQVVLSISGIYFNISSIMELERGKDSIVVE
jgi:hypothetical protein